MKAKLITMMIGLILFANSSISAQRKVTVEAVSEDISYYLDLKAVAYIFGESSNLEDFEYKLNDNDNNISNLDLNGDGYVDYLRVVEVNENKVHLVVIQAILDNDVYQDVATIVVGRNSYNKLNIQVIGDPYLYGSNYIIEPYYYRTPSIISWFWSPFYTRWHSPFYWGYYPRHYSYHRPLEINIYLSNINRRIYRNNNHYRYSNEYRYNNYNHLRNSISRNDYGRINPDKNFNRRNNEYRNKQELNMSRSNREGVNNGNITPRGSVRTRNDVGYNNSENSNRRINESGINDRSRNMNNSRNFENSRNNNNSEKSNSRFNNDGNRYERNRTMNSENRNIELSRPATRSNSDYQVRNEKSVSPENREIRQSGRSSVTERTINSEKSVERQYKPERTENNANRAQRTENVRTKPMTSVQTPSRATERTGSSMQIQRQSSPRSHENSGFSNRSSGNRESRR